MSDTDASTDLQKQNQKNIRAIYAHVSDVDQKQFDPAGDGGWAKSLGISKTKSDADRPLAEVNAENLARLAKQMGVPSSKLDESATGTDFSDVFGPQK